MLNSVFSFLLNIYYLSFDVMINNICLKEKKRQKLTYNIDVMINNICLKEKKRQNLTYNIDVMINNICLKEKILSFLFF
jgi:hypothetical protein